MRSDSSIASSRSPRNQGKDPIETATRYGRDSSDEDEDEIKIVGGHYLTLAYILVITDPLIKNNRLSLHLHEYSSQITALIYPVV